MPASANPTINLDVAPTLRLEVAAAQPEFRSGTAVALRFVVTNVGRATCALTDLPDGAITVLSERRNGAALSPSFSPLLPIDGTSELIAQHTAPVAARASTSFTVTSTPGHGFEVPALLPDETELLASWPTQEAGEYRFRLVYEVPALAGSSGCAGESNAVMVSFRVSGPRSRTWLVPTIAVGVGGGLLVVVVVIEVGRGRSRRRGAGPATGAAMAVVLVAASVATITAVAAPARADVVFRNYGGTASSNEYSYCQGQIEKFDPSVFNTFDYPDSPNLYIDTAHETDTHFYGRNSIVNWDPDEHRTFSDGVKGEPCSALYHELVHAKDNADGTVDKGPCGDTGIETTEVVATLAENRYRAAHYMKPRLNYGPNRMPASLAACKVPMDIFDKILGLTTGDPHLTTFDGQRYDFQAVGEFTLVTSKTGDLAIQVRQAELGTLQSVAVNSAVAMKVGVTQLGFYLTDGYITVYRNLRAVNVAVGRTPLAGGAVLALSYDPYKGALYQVRWADGTVASVWRAGIYGLVVSVAPGKDRAGTLSGLLGDYDLHPMNGVRAKGGRLLAPTFSSLYPGFADSWRVNQATSLFNYPKGATTATYTDRSFPRRPAIFADLSPAQRRSALLACRAAGLTQRVDLADCGLDVAVTGSADLAASAAEADQEKVGTGRATGTTHPGSGLLATTIISKPGTGAHTTFVGRRGQRVMVEVVSTTLPYQCGTLTLHGPDDNLLAEGCTGKGTSIEGTLLPSNGVYSIDLSPSGGATGRATLRIFLSEDRALSSSIDGAPLTASVVVPGGQTRIFFQGDSWSEHLRRGDQGHLPRLMSLRAGRSTRGGAGARLHP